MLLMPDRASFLYCFPVEIFQPSPCFWYALIVLVFRALPMWPLYHYTLWTSHIAGCVLFAIHPTVFGKSIDYQMDLFKKRYEKSPGSATNKSQTFPDPKRKRKPTNPNKHKSNKRTKSTKISSLFPKRGNRNTKRTKKHKNKMTHGKTYNKSLRRINHKATKSRLTPGPPP